MKFHKRHGNSIELSTDDTVAENKDDGFGLLSDFTVFSSEPVEPGQTVTVKVLQAKHRNFVSFINHNIESMFYSKHK